MESRAPVDTDDTSWSFRTYPIDAPSSAFGTFAPFIDLWRGKHTGEGGFPAWRDFELLDFKKWWGKLSLAELDGETGDVRFVLWGTLLTEWWGCDYTKKRLAVETILREPARSSQVAYYEALSSGTRIGFNWGSFENTGRGFMRVKLVDLPLSADHDRTTHVLSAADTFEPESQVPPSIEPLA